MPARRSAAQLREREDAYARGRREGRVELLTLIRELAAVLQRRSIGTPHEQRLLNEARQIAGEP